MKSIISANWLRRPGTFFASAALALTALGVCVAPALTTPEEDKIAEKMTELQASDERWVEINLTRQRLIAWEGSTPVYAIIVSTGKRSTPTRTGIFAIQTKHRSTRMRGIGYDVPNVPHAMFYQGNYAIHGAYWHRRFGTPVSHGCVNVAPNHARWLFNWASVGTPVLIHE